MIIKLDYSAAPSCLDYMQQSSILTTLTMPLKGNILNMMVSFKSSSNVSCNWA